MTDQLRAEMEKWEKLYHVATASAELLLEMLESERAKSAKLREALRKAFSMMPGQTDEPTWPTKTLGDALKESGDE